MRTCIHSSAYNPSVHTILGGPYSSTSQCESACSSPSTTLPPITTTPNPNLPLLPPIVSFMNGTNVFNINSIPVRIFPQYVLDANTITSPWVDLPSVIVNAKSNYDLLDSLAAEPTTTPDLDPSQILPFNTTNGRGAGIIRARCVSQGSTINKISDYSLTSYTGYAGNAVIPSYANIDNILAPVLSGRRIYNPNAFTVIALVEYAYWTNNTSQLGLERNWTDFRLSPIIIDANSFSSEINTLNNSSSILSKSLRARFVKNDSISTSVSAYGNNYA
jgi:hypothetical protein